MGWWVEWQLEWSWRSGVRSGLEEAVWFKWDCEHPVDIWRPVMINTWSRVVVHEAHCQGDAILGVVCPLPFGPWRTLMNTSGYSSHTCEKQAIKRAWFDSMYLSDDFNLIRWRTYPLPPAHALWWNHRMYSILCSYVGDPLLHAYCIYLDACLHCVALQYLTMHPPQAS